MDYISEGKCVPIHIISLLGRSHLGGEKKNNPVETYSSFWDGFPKYIEFQILPCDLEDSGAL